MYGQKGARYADLRVNAFPVKLNPRVETVYHYDVALSTKQKDATQKFAKETRRRVLRVLLSIKDTPLYNQPVVHDQMHSIYSTRKLPSDEFKIENVRLDERADANGFTVEIKLVQEIDLRILDQHRHNAAVRPPTAALQALDVALRYVASSKFMIVGRNFFSTSDAIPLTGAKELCWGYHQALRLGQRGLFLNIDQATTAFHRPGPLINSVLSVIGGREVRELYRGLSQSQARKVEAALKGVHVSVSHMKDSRRKRIIGLGTAAADETRFKIDDREISVTQYFAERYDIRLQFGMLPCIQVAPKSRNIFLPMEVVHVAKEQHCSFQAITDADIATIVRHASTKPRKRQENILRRVNDAGFPQDRFLQSFGLFVQPSMLRIQSRILNDPEVVYANSSVRPRAGVWNLRDKRFLEGMELRNWVVVVFADIGRRPIENFVNLLVKMARTCGMKVPNDRPRIISGHARHGRTIPTIVNAVEQEAKERRQRIDLVLCIKQDSSADQYREIKRASDTILGIPSQCVVVKNAMKASPQVCANICMKINMKLGGRNSRLGAPLPLISEGSVIVFGADVSHGIDKYSIAALSASLDRTSCRYATRVVPQDKNSEEIGDLKMLVQDLLQTYSVRNDHVKPKHLVFFRDGISEGEFQKVMNAELTGIRAACEALEAGYLPRIVYIVIRKRHHIRFFSSEKAYTDRSGNVVPGTLVDNVITNPHLPDFYLVSHAGIQGTSCPTNYTVLLNESQLSLEALEEMTYHLCYTYSRCARSVSVVPPVYYAHLAAYRGRFFIEDQAPEAEEKPSIEEAPTFGFIPVHKNSVNSMYFL